jgi:hypothetical protein
MKIILKCILIKGQLRKWTYTSGTGWLQLALDVNAAIDGQVAVKRLKY